MKRLLPNEGVNPHISIQLYAMRRSSHAGAASRASSRASNTYIIPPTYVCTPYSSGTDTSNTYLYNLNAYSSALRNVTQSHSECAVCTLYFQIVSSFIIVE